MPSWRSTSSVTGRGSELVKMAHPLPRPELDVVETAPRSPVADQLGLVEPDHRLGVRVEGGEQARGALDVGERQVTVPWGISVMCAPAQVTRRALGFTRRDASGALLSAKTDG